MSCMFKGQLTFPSTLRVLIVPWADTVFQSAEEVKPGHRATLFLSATVQELSGSKSIPFLSYWPHETVPAGAQEKRMKR